MDKKGGLVLSVIILAAVFVAGAIIGGPAISAAVDKSPPSIGRNTFVNANECTADEICENNAIKVGDPGLLPEHPEGSIFVENNIGVGGNLHASIGTFEVLQVDNDLTVDESISGEHLFIGDMMFFSPTDIIADYMASGLPQQVPQNNTAGYVCVDTIGRLYRSQEPCV